MLSSSEKIRIILKRKNMSITDLADKLGTSRQNLNNKLARDNFVEKDLHEIAEAIGCDLNIIFTDKESKENL